MSEKPKESTVADDLLSGGEDTLGSSISLSLGENSVRLREKSKSVEETEYSARHNSKIDDKKWWLKRPETRLGISVTTKNAAVANVPKATPTPDVSSSMKEFLEKEEFCKGQHKNEAASNRDKDDTLCDILASAAFDKYPSDFENATDEDIGSFLEEMSKIAGALSPNSAPEREKSGENSSKNPTDEEKSVEELLEEAERLVRKNVVLSKSASRSDTLILDDVDNQAANDSGIGRLEKDIFQLIEQEVHRETEKIRKSPKNEKKLPETSPSYEILYENINTLKPPKFSTLESQKKRFDEHKVEVSSSSDLDDPIDRYSRLEDSLSIEKPENDKVNLRKEITDVDKDFFDDLLRRSKEKIEGGMSGSSSFGQEDFSHFLRILQVQDRKDQETKDQRVTAKCATSKFPKSENLANNANVPYPEREITEILEKELPIKTKKKHIVEANDAHEFGESDSSVASVDLPSKNRKRQIHSKHSSEDRSLNHEEIPSVNKKPVYSRHSSLDDSKKIERRPSSEKLKNEEGKKVVNSKSELYTVGLTPRLELFADAIPKLIAERSNENFRNEENEERKIEATGRTEDYFLDERKIEKSSEEPKKRDLQEKDVKNVVPGGITEDKIYEMAETTNFDRPTNPPPLKSKSPRLGPSRSYDQLAKPGLNLRSSLDDVRGTKSSESSRRSHQQPAKTSSGILKGGKQQTRQVSSSKQVPKMKLSLKPSTSKFNLLPKSKTTTSKTENLGKYSLAAGDSRRNLTKDDYEALCREERHKNALLREQIDSEAKLYKQQMQNMRTSFEEELFALKKQNIILKAKIDEFSLNEKRVDFPSKITSKTDTRMRLLEGELEKQEGIINAYETENKRLVIEMEQVQEEMKNFKLKQKTKIETSEIPKLNDTIKDLREEILKLNLEIGDLRQKNVDEALKIDDALQQNSLLKEELEMFKDQLRTKNDFINARLQSMTAAELESRKKTEDLRRDLSSKTEQLKNIELDYEKLQQAVLPLEKELLELRMREGGLTEKLQIAKTHVEREKQLTIKLKDQVILDNKKILDLNRQVREMERILKRKNPDSVSALILTAKSDHERIHLEKIKLLEDRVASLEGEIKAKEEIGHEKLTDLQKKFAEMKEKYVMQIMELEAKLLEATIKERKVYNDMFTQTTIKSVENKSVDAANPRREDCQRSTSVQMDRDEKKESKGIKVGPKSQNPKEDTHLIATIRGLKMEIANKDKSLGKMSKECQELQKTNRRLQKERERLLNDRRNFKLVGDAERNGRSASVGSEPRTPAGRTAEASDMNSNNYQNGHLSNGNNQRLSGSVPRLYDPLQYSENDERTTIKKLNNENGILKEELNKINKDFMTLKNKRLHDLNLLQEEHEREMAALVKEYSVKFGDSKVVKLQSQINTQVAIITHLKQQIEKLRDYKEQVLVLKVEREHLENKVKLLNEKVKYLSTPGTEQLQLLQDKITILQQRHESREMTLQSLVRDLLRNKTQCRDCKGEKGKSKEQLCYFRQELDHILGMLQEISSVQ